MPTQSITVVHKRSVVKTGTASTTTVTDQKTTADVERNGWERALDPGGWVIFRILLVVLAAFLAGATAQRILLGEYTIKIGLLELDEIILKDVVSAGQTTKEGFEESRSAGGAGALRFNRTPIK